MHEDYFLFVSISRLIYLSRATVCVYLSRTQNTICVETYLALDTRTLATRVLICIDSFLFLCTKFFFNPFDDYNIVNGFF